VGAVFQLRAAFIFRFKKVVGPAQDFFNSGDEVFLVGCEVSESVGYIFDTRSRGGCGSQKIRGRGLGGEEAVVNNSKSFKGETEPGGAVVCAVWGVEGGGEEFTEAI
jgi:hypothetical protein